MHARMLVRGPSTMRFIARDVDSFAGDLPPIFRHPITACITHRSLNYQHFSFVYFLKYRCPTIFTSVSPPHLEYCNYERKCSYVIGKIPTRIGKCDVHFPRNAKTWAIQLNWHIEPKVQTLIRETKLRGMIKSFKHH